MVKSDNITKLAIKFAKLYWDIVDKERFSIEETKEKFISNLKRNSALCGWFLTEVLAEKLDAYKVSSDPYVIHVEKSYYMLEYPFVFHKVKRKVKKIVCFEK